MKWTDYQNFRISLLDDSGAAVLGQVIKDDEAHWQAWDYVSEGARGVPVLGSPFDTPEQAKLAVELSIKAGMGVS
jgi:hypothetical protein